MYSKTFCAAVQGIEGRIIQVEADISDGLPGFSLVGDLSPEVKEARERVRIALQNSGYRFPPRKVTVNLSPADIRKDGTGYDLAIAIAVLSAYGYIPENHFENIIWIGELSLKGEIRPVSGVLPRVYTGLEHGMRYCVLAKGNQEEAAAVAGMSVVGVGSLRELTELLEQERLDENAFAGSDKKVQRNETGMDFQDVMGQESARRAAEVAASGMHNLLMIGPPGSGKSMIAGRMAGILPTMTFGEQMEISRIYSVAGLLSEEKPIVQARPFRAPHHTITQTSLVGGGAYPKPGEVSLASGGVLFLDELPEFDRNAIEVLRQPLEDGRVHISRLGANCYFPAHTLLMAAMNPCKCGWYPDRTRCRCSPGQVRRYLGRISQPLLDRIDICTETVPIDYSQLSGGQRDICGDVPGSLRENLPESSAAIRQRVEEVQKQQVERYRGEDFCHNAGLTPQTIKKYCHMTKEAEEYLEQIYRKMEFTARAYHKILKVGRTVADMAGSVRIEKEHIAEAVFYRSIDRRYWGGAE